MTDDRYRAVLDSVFAASAYRWAARPDPFAVLRRIWNAFVDWLIRLWARNPKAFEIVAWALAVVLAIVAVRAVWVLISAFRAPIEPDAAVPSTATSRGPAWFRHEAVRLRAAGRWLEAMQADFHALLLELDARRLVRYHPAKTPQEYVADATLDEAGRARFRDLVWTLYRHEYGRDPVTAAVADAWRDRTGADHYAPAH